MSGIIIFLHIVICLLLIMIILMQSGRGGGLTEAFASAESMFGAQTSSFLIKGTTILASIFLVTNLTLAFISSRKNESIMSKMAAEAAKKAPQQPIVITPPKTEEPQKTEASPAAIKMELPSPTQGAFNKEMPAAL